jgi:hypothetical protein
MTATPHGGQKWMQHDRHKDRARWYRQGRAWFLAEEDRYNQEIAA